MKVAQLIEQLTRMDQDAEVHYRVPSGDYWGNELAFEAGQVQSEYIEFSDYHRENKLVDPESDSFNRENSKRIVLIDT